MKAAILVLSDPKTGSEEAFGRVVSALTAACYFKQSGAEVTVLFQGAGRRWLAEISKPTHPVHALFEEIKEMIVGLSCPHHNGDSTLQTERSDHNLLNNDLTQGGCELPGLQKLITEGYAILTF